MINLLLGEFSKFVNKYDDDIIDRCNHRYTVIVLSTFITIIATKQYFGDPIICWAPAQFTGSHTAYANTICWTHGTYPVETDQLYHTVDRTKLLPYYQWIPFILLFQILCFCLPNLIWHGLSRKTGIDVGSLIKKALKEENPHKIAENIHTSLITKYEYDPLTKRFSITKKLPIGKQNGNYLYFIYLFVKILYIANIFTQLFLMNSFFGFRYHSYGMDFLRKFFQGEDYSRMDLAFPRVTFCDFKIRNMADNIHQHSLQCALPINLLNEKFFIFLWFWLIAVLILTILNFLRWTFLLLPAKRASFFEKYLKVAGIYGHSKENHYEFDPFVREYCHLDGAFVLSLIRRNTNFITSSKIVESLWKCYVEEKKKDKSFTKEGGNEELEKLTSEFKE